MTLAYPKHEKLGASLRWKTIKVSNPILMWEGWPQEINHLYERLRVVADKRIERYGYTGKKLARFQGANLAFFVSCWWPRARWEACVIILYWVIWLFIWDDEIDRPENEVGSNFAVAQAFRQESFLFIEHCLGFCKRKSPPTPPNPIINSFEDIGKGLRKYYNEEQRRRFLGEIKFYFFMTQMEQEHKFNDELPTVDEYWKIRMGSSTVYPCLSMAELAINYTLPICIFGHSDMRILWDQINIIISINDILSLKKELQSNGVLSTIPLSCLQGMDVQTAVDHACEVMQTAVDEVNVTAKRLLSEVPENTPEHEALVDYIDVLKTNQTGHYHWSVRSKRYFLIGAVQEDESIAIVL